MNDRIISVPNSRRVHVPLIDNANGSVQYIEMSPIIRDYLAFIRLERAMTGRTTLIKSSFKNWEKYGF